MDARKTLQTVTGPVPVRDLGRTLMHEHLFIAFPGSWFDPRARYDRAELVAEAVRKLVQLRVEHGVRTFVDPCPIEMGRDVAMMKEVSEKSGVHIVCTTGFYYEEHGIPSYWRARTVDEVAELYIGEIAHGIGDTGIKAGAIKVATSPVITPQEKKFLAAACSAQRATGVPIITHTTGGIGGPEQQELFASGGVAAYRCLIGHCCMNPDHAYHRRVVDAGSYIGFDQIGTLTGGTDDIRADNVAKLVHAGFGPQVMMSMDRICVRLGRFNFQPTPAFLAKMEKMKAEGKWQVHTHLFTDFIPKLRERGVAQTDIDAILQENPRRYFAGEPLPLRAGH